MKFDYFKLHSFFAILFPTFLLLTGCSKNVNDLTSQDKVPVKVVVVTMFEIGEDEGDDPGEFQLWKTRQKLDQKFQFPHSHHDLFYNPETQVLGMVTGMGTAKSATATMALGLDNRFDLSKAYWLVAGIAGIDPEDASIGSVVWSSFLVDGDLGYEIDAREIPEDWDTGFFPLFSKEPYDVNKPNPIGEVFKANEALRDWAFYLTKDLELRDGESLLKHRNLYVNHPNAMKPPFVLRGGHIAAMTFWHGVLKNKWANDWVAYWSDGATNFYTSAMEDTGTYQALEYLDNIDKVDVERLLVLRGGSNFTMQPPGLTAAENLLVENEEYAAMEASLENIYLVGSTVVDELVSNWAIFKDTPPGS